MRGVIFWQTLRHHWRQALYWGGGIGLLGIYILLALPNVDMLEQYAQLMETMPPLVLQAFGATDAAQLATPEGFIGFGYFSYMMLIMGAYAVGAGLNVTAVEEDRGILDVLLSAPISRTQLMIEKILAYRVIILLIILVSFGFLAAGAVFSIPMDMGKLFAGSLNMLPASLTVLGFTVFVGAWVRVRTTALAISAGFVVVGYFFDFIGRAASESVINVLTKISYYSYYGGGQFMSTGVVWGNVAILIAVGLILFVAGVAVFQRRDIGL